MCKGPGQRMLDVFREKQDNEDVTIHDKFEAWLTFLCRDEPEKIIQLIELYPEFKPLYEDIYELCRNTEKVMGMFSKELLEMDRNTVKLMIDEMQDEVDELIKERDEAARERDEITKECDEITKERDEITKERDVYLKACEEKDREIEELKRRLAKA